VSTQSEESRVLQEAHWDVGIEEVQKQEMKVGRWLALLILVWRVTRYVSCSVTGTILIPGGRPDRRRLKADAPAFSYDAGDTLPLAGGV